MLQNKDDKLMNVTKQRRQINECYKTKMTN